MDGVYGPDLRKLGTVGPAASTAFCLAAALVEAGNPEAAKRPEMNEYPPGGYIADAIQTLPPAGPDVPPQAVEIDAGAHWGRFWVTFEAKRNTRGGMGRHWFWAMASGNRMTEP